MGPTIAPEAAPAQAPPSPPAGDQEVRRLAVGANRRIGFNTVITSASSAVALLTGGVLALLIAAKFGSSAKTDGFFVAYGIYSVPILAAQALRTGFSARLLESPTRFGVFDSFVTAMVALSLVCGVVFVGLGAPLAHAVNGGLPSIAYRTAHTGLVYLWPAAAGQLFSSLGAAMLALLGDYTVAAIAFATGGVSSIVAFLALAPELDIEAVPAGLLLGSVLTTVMIAVALWRRGWRPRAREVLDLRRARRPLSLFMQAASSNLISQAVYVASLAVAARVGTGVITIFSYGYFARGVVQSLVGASVSIVLAAPLAATWDRNPRSLRGWVDSIYRPSVVLLVPIVAAAALVGTGVCTVVLAKLSRHEVSEVIAVFLILSPTLFTFQAGAVPTIAMYTLGRYRSMALLPIPVGALQVAVCAVAAVTHSLWWLAAAVTASTVARFVGVLALLYGRRTLAVCRGLLVDTVKIGLPGAACFALAWLAAWAAGIPATDPIALIVGLAVYGLLVTRFAPDYTAGLVRLARTVRRPARAVGASPA